jgi:hypothetical protein
MPDVPADKASNCDYLVGTYDYARAQRLIHAVRSQSGSLSGRGPFLMMVIADSSGLHVLGLDGSDYDEAGFGRFVDTWGQSVNRAEAIVAQQPDQPGLVRSIFNLIAAVFRTVGGVTAGIIRGVVEGL